MGKNSHIHLVIETSSLDKLRQQAEDSGLSISEICRRKINSSEIPQLSRMERMIYELTNKINNL